MKKLIVKLILANIIAVALYFLYLQFQSKPVVNTTGNNPTTIDPQANSKASSTVSGNVQLLPKPVEETKTPIVEPTNTNSADFEFKINSVVSSARSYVNNSDYNFDTHTQIMSELTLLYDVKGLSRKQNNALENSISAMRQKQSRHFAPIKATQTVEVPKKQQEIAPNKKDDNEPKQADIENTESKDKKKIVEYIVKDQETFYTLKVRFKMSIDRLKAINPSITDINNIAIGQKINVEIDKD